MPKSVKISAETIDALLPQTQCGQCGHGACFPYAQALAEQRDTINHCPPGGINTLLALGSLLACDPKPYLEEMANQQQSPRRVVIDEAVCIGCTKCIQACPVDAIVGAAKQMHTVINDQCTGCELCIAPCPVDCIKIVDVTTLPEPELSRERYQFRQWRLAREQAKKAQQQIDARAAAELNNKKAEITAAVARVKAKRAQTSQSYE